MTRGGSLASVPALLAAVICVPALAQATLNRNVTLDDPFITYRYAANLVAGNGLVWNAGEPPVEGYTTFLWAILNAGAVMGRRQLLGHRHCFLRGE